MKIRLLAFATTLVFSTGALAQPADPKFDAIKAKRDRGEQLTSEEREYGQGTYATGNRPGDRVIVVREDGRVEFSEVGTTGGINANTDTYQLGRHGAKFRLSTHDSGVVDVLNLETLVYYHDTYRR